MLIISLKSKAKHLQTNQIFGKNYFELLFQNQDIILGEMAQQLLNGHMIELHVN